MESSILLKFGGANVGDLLLSLKLDFEWTESPTGNGLSFIGFNSLTGYG